MTGSDFEFSLTSASYQVCNFGKLLNLSGLQFSHQQIDDIHHSVISSMTRPNIVLSFPETQTTEFLIPKCSHFFYSSIFLLMKHYFPPTQPVLAL